MGKKKKKKVAEPVVLNESNVEAKKKEEFKIGF